MSREGKCLPWSETLTSHPHGVDKESLIHTHIHRSAFKKELWLNSRLSGAVCSLIEESVCQFLRLIHTSPGCLDLTLISQYEVNARNHTHYTHTPQYHWKKVDAYTPFQSLYLLLWILLGGPPSIHEFRNIFCQLAVRTQQVSLQH